MMWFWKGVGEVCVCVCVSFLLLPRAPCVPDAAALQYLDRSTSDQVQKVLSLTSLLPPSVAGSLDAGRPPLGLELHLRPPTLLPARQGDQLPPNGY